MLPIDSYEYEWVWLLALAACVIGGTYLERWLSQKERPVARRLVGFFSTIALLAVGVWALTAGREIIAFFAFAGVLGAALRAVILYTKRNG